LAIYLKQIRIYHVSALIAVLSAQGRFNRSPSPGCKLQHATTAAIAT